MKQLFIGVSTLILISCGGARSSSDEAYSEASYNMEEMSPAGEMTVYDYHDEKNDAYPEGEEIEIDQKLIKTGNIGFECSDIKVKRGAINQLIKQYKCYVSDETEDYYSNRINQYITVKIPNANFEKFVTALCDGVDRFDTKSIEVQDVTADFVDTDARIANKKALEQKYISLLDKAKNVEEILKVEKEINYLREDIEVAEAHLLSLTKQVSYSTLELYIYELLPVKKEEVMEEPNRFAKGFVAGWNAIVDFFVGLTYAWPTIIILIVVGFVLRRKWKKEWKEKYFSKM